MFCSWLVFETWMRHGLGPKIDELMFNVMPMATLLMNEATMMY